MEDVYIIGVHTTTFGKHLALGIKDLTAMTVSGGLADAGIGKEAIQAVWFSNSGWGDQKGQSCIRGQVALRPFGIDAIPITNVENACASGSTALHHAWMAVASGLYDIALAVGAEKLYNSNKSAIFAGFLAGIDIENVLEISRALSVFSMGEQESDLMEAFLRKYPPSGNRRKTKGGKRLKASVKEIRDQLVVAISLGEKLGYSTVKELRKLMAGDHSPFMDIYGYAARKHMRMYGTTVEQLALIASKNHHNSTLNPNAQYRFEVPIEKVLRDRIVSFPLTRAMCAPIGDGAACAVVCSKKVVQRLGVSSRAVRIRASILGSGKACEADSGEPDIGERLARKAYETAGVGPSEMHMAEVHDATAFGELHQAENLGFCPRGEGGRFAESGATCLDGTMPINPSGGLTSRGHPIGASGLAQIHELSTQLRREAGQRQIPKAVLAIAENGGGALGSEEAAMCMHILEAPAKL